MYNMHSNAQKKHMQKEKQMLENMIANMFLEDVRVIECTLKVIFPIKRV